MILFDYIKYLLKARHWRGHGIHSPFVFRLATRVIGERNPYYAFEPLARFGKQAHYPRSARKYGETLFRVINSSNAQQLLFVHSSELDVLYGASVAQNAVFLFVSTTAQKEDFLRKGCSNVEVVRSLPEALRQAQTLDFVHFGAVSPSEIEACLPYIRPNMLFVFSDIFGRNRENWELVVSRPETRLSIALFRLGLVYFNPELQKENYTLLY